MKPPRSLVFAAFAAALALPASGQIFVDDSATGANDGTSWQDAYTDLQSALSISTLGAEVWVARGTYRPTPGLDRAATFDVFHQVYGGFDGTETSLAARAGLFDETILSGDLLGDDGPAFANRGDNSHHVARFGPFATALLDGFTIRGGNAGEAPWSVGGGLASEFFVIDGLVRNCTFVDNQSRRSGGGIGGGAKSLLRVERCTFVGNRALESGGGASLPYSTEIVACRFLGNRAGDAGGGLFSGFRAIGCEFSGNVAGRAGGGLFGTQEAWNCTFSENEAAAGGGAGGGPPWSTTDLTNCVLWGNRGGGGSALEAQLSGDVIVDDGIVEGWDGSIPGARTIDADPRFRAPLGADGVAGTLDDDLSVERGSPCVDTGRSAGFPGPALDVRGRPWGVDSLACDLGGSIDRGAIERQAVDGTTTYCDSTPSSLGVPAELSSPCLVLGGGGAFAAVASPVPAGRAVLLAGVPAAPQPFGDGVLCLGGTLARLGTTVSSGGAAGFAVDPASLPGATFAIQVAYRDPAAGGAGFNLSSTMRIVFLP